MPNDEENARQGETELVNDPTAALRQPGVTEILDLNAPGAEPVTDPMSGLPVREPTPATPEQEAHSAKVLSDPVRAIMEPGFADQGTTREAPLVQMEPGHADGGHTDLYPNETQNGSITVLRPGTPGGFQPTSKTIEGVAPGAAKAITGQQENVNAAKRSADEEANAAQQRYVDYVNDQATRQYQDNQAADLANAAELTRNQMVQARIQDKMAAVAKFKPDREQMFEGTAGGFRAAAAVIGMLFGGALAGLNGGPNQAQEAVFHLIDENVREQVRQNSAVYEELKQRLGDEQAAAIALRQKHLEYAKNIMDAQLLGRQGQQAQAALGGAKQRTELEIQNGNLQLMERLAPHEKLALAHVAPTPTQILTLDKQEQMLKQYGVTPEMRMKFMQQKIGGGDASPTVNQALVDVKQAARDINTLESIREAYGGKLPGYDSPIDWNRSATLRALGGRLGFTKSVDAAKVYALVGKNVMKRARTYGGPVTPSDEEAAMKELGVNGDQLLEALNQQKDQVNETVAGVANGYFGNNGQRVLDIMNAGVAGTPGVRTAGLTPR